MHADLWKSWSSLSPKSVEFPDDCADMTHELHQVFILFRKTCFRKTNFWRLAVCWEALSESCWKSIQRKGNVRKNTIWRKAFQCQKRTTKLPRHCKKNPKHWVVQKISTRLCGNLEKLPRRSTKQDVSPGWHRMDDLPKLWNFFKNGEKIQAAPNVGAS